MDKLRLLVERLTTLAQQNRWQDILAEDEQVRQVIDQETATVGPADRPQIAVLLQVIQKIYQDGAARLESSKGQSATEIKSLQNGLRAARSYLDNTRF